LGLFRKFDGREENHARFALGFLTFSFWRKEVDRAR